MQSLRNSNKGSPAFFCEKKKSWRISKNFPNNITSEILTFGFYFNTFYIDNEQANLIDPKQNNNHFVNNSLNYTILFCQLYLNADRVHKLKLLLLNILWWHWPMFAPPRPLHQLDMFLINHHGNHLQTPVKQIVGIETFQSKEWKEMERILFILILKTETSSIAYCLSRRRPPRLWLSWITQGQHHVIIGTRWELNNSHRICIPHRVPRIQ